MAMEEVAAVVVVTMMSQLDSQLDPLPGRRKSETCCNARHGEEMVTGRSPHCHR